MHESDVQNLDFKLRIDLGKVDDDRLDDIITVPIS